MIFILIMYEQLQSKPIECNKGNSDRCKTRYQQSKITTRMAEAAPREIL